MSGPKTISYQFLLNEFSVAQEDETLYLHRSTGELQLVAESSIAGLCDADEKAIPAKEKAFIDRVRHILISDDWLALPSPIHEADLSVLEKFAESFALNQLGDNLFEDEALRNLVAVRFKSLVRAGFSQPVLDFLEEKQLEQIWTSYRQKHFQMVLQYFLSHDGFTLLP